MRRVRVVALVLVAAALAACDERTPRVARGRDAEVVTPSSLREAARALRRSSRPREERWELAERLLRSALAIADECETRADLTSLYLERALVAPVAEEEAFLRESIDRCTRDQERGQWWERIWQLRQAAGALDEAGKAACTAVAHGAGTSAATCVRLGKTSAEPWTLRLAESFLVGVDDRKREVELLEQVVADRPEQAVAWERLAFAAHAVGSPRACEALGKVESLTSPTSDFARARFEELSRQLACP